MCISKATLERIFCLSNRNQITLTTENHSILDDIESENRHDYGLQGENISTAQTHLNDNEKIDFNFCGGGIDAKTYNQMRGPLLMTGLVFFFATFISGSVYIPLSVGCAISYFALMVSYFFCSIRADMLKSE